jgi:SAM-dependent methyltransferase
MASSPQPVRPVDVHRAAELDVFREVIPPGSVILDVGAGSGFQAVLLSSWGHQVKAVDLRHRTPAPVQYTHVMDYDGIRLPFEDQSFDVVLTSHVLAHVPDAHLLLREIRRVLKHDGQAIHVVPSALWRIASGAAHYIAVIPRLFSVALSAASHVLPGGSENKQTPSRTSAPLRARVLNTLFPPPLGAAPTSMHEVFSFRRRTWIRLCESADFVVTEVRRCGLFYTGFFFWAAMPLRNRRILSRLLFSSSMALLTRKTESHQ